MRVGVIGKGLVGSAVYDGLGQINNAVSFYDPKYPESKFEDILDTECVFVCVPTNSLENGDCDTYIVDCVIDDLHSHKYSGVIIIKSTVIPGTTKRLQETYSNDKICFVPEFLRERSALADFMEKHDVLIVGTDSDEIYDLVVKVHGNIPKNSRKLSPTEAELSKYFSNVYNSLRITFANGFFDVCQKLNCDYQKILDAVSLREGITQHYLRASKYLRGYSGVCLPKDSQAFANLVDNLGLRLELFKAIINDNNKYRKTVFKGMRK